MYSNFSGATLHPTISNNHIYDNEIGITLNGYTMPLISGNRIENNTEGGIQGFGNASATVTFNLITGTGYSAGYAVEFSNNSLAQVHRNTIWQNDCGGIYAGSSSNLLARGASNNEGRNIITSNYGHGILAENSSPNFGEYPTGLWGNNEIHDNAGYQAWQIGSGLLRAFWCYWAGQQWDVSGNVDNSGYLTSAPSPVGWGQSDGYDPSLLVAPGPDDPAHKNYQSGIASLSKAGEQSEFAPVEWSAKYAEAMSAGLEKDDWGDAAKVITQLWRELQDARVPEVDYALLAGHVDNAKVELSIRKYLALTLVEKSLAVRDIPHALADLEKYRRSINEHDTELLTNVGMVKLQFLKDPAAAEEILAQLHVRASQGDLLAAAEARSLSIMINRYRKRLDNSQLPRPANHSSALATEEKIISQMGNYPNPFNPETTIRFYLPDREKVRLIIYDLTGQHVRILADGEFSAGEQTISWDGRNQNGRPVTSGIYLYELVVGNKIERKKMTLIR